MRIVKYNNNNNQTDDNNNSSSDSLPPDRWDPAWVPIDPA